VSAPNNVAKHFCLISFFITYKLLQLYRVTKDVSTWRHQFQTITAEWRNKKWIWNE